MGKGNIVRIGDRELKVRNTIRAIFIFEQITGKAFEIKTMLDNHLFFYSVILANNPESTMSWDEFLDAADNDPELIGKMNGLLSEGEKIDRMLNGEAEEDGAQKKS